MPLTTLQIINIAKVSQYLAQNDVAKGNLFSPRKIPITPQILYAERKAVEWLYNLDPTNSTLTLTGNYLYSLCRGYNLQAQNIINTGGGGSVSPVTPTAPNIFPLYLKSSDFSDSTHYNNPNIVGFQMALFVNEYTQQWLFMPDDIVGTTTGINVLVPGFNALTDDYTMMLINVNTP